MRPSLRLAAAAALAAALPLLPGRADAQPACTDASFETYLATGFTCQLRGFAFSDFGLIADATATDASASAFTVDAAVARLRPFERFDALGRVEFGFGFDDFAIATAAAAGPGAADAVARASLTFVATALSGTVISRAGFDVEFTSVSPTPGRTAVDSWAIGAVTDCVFRFIDQQGPTAGGLPVQRSPDESCAPRPSAFLTVLALESITSRSDSPRAQAGSAQVTMQEVRYTIPGVVVPEPSTWALLGTGLLALGGVAARRRRG